MSVGFAVTSIPPLALMLGRAIDSIIKQTHPIDQISVAIDHIHAGAGPTRNRAKNALRTEWTCFLDDDDTLRAYHVSDLLAHQAETGADLVFPWFDVVGGDDPFPQFEGLPWDPAAPRMFPITVLVRTELAQSIDFKAPHELVDGGGGEDWWFWRELDSNGATFSHLPKRTWKWHHNSGNTSGRPDRW